MRGGLVTIAVARGREGGDLGGEFVDMVVGGGLLDGAVLGGLVEGLGFVDGAEEGRLGDSDGRGGLVDLDLGIDEALDNFTCDGRRELSVGAGGFVDVGMEEELDNLACDNRRGISMDVRRDGLCVVEGRGLSESGGTACTELIVRTRADGLSSLPPGACEAAICSSKNFLFFSSCLSTSFFL